jgi:DNA-binding NarL/FixJ family response regulator
VGVIVWISVALAVLAISAATAVFVYFSAEVKKLKRAHSLATQNIETLRQESSREQSGLLNEVQRLDRCLLQVAPKPNQRTGLNFTVRSQVIKMYRQGLSLEKISAETFVPVNEVRLILKVYRNLLQSAAELESGRESQETFSRSGA